MASAALMAEFLTAWASARAMRSSRWVSRCFRLLSQPFFRLLLHQGDGLLRIVDDLLRGGDSVAVLLLVVGEEGLRFAFQACGFFKVVFDTGGAGVEQGEERLFAFYIGDNREDDGREQNPRMRIGPKTCWFCFHGLALLHGGCDRFFGVRLVGSGHRRLSARYRRRYRPRYRRENASASVLALAIPCSAAARRLRALSANLACSSAMLLLMSRSAVETLIAAVSCALARDLSYSALTRSALSFDPAAIARSPSFCVRRSFGRFAHTRAAEKPLTSAHIRSRSIRTTRKSWLGYVLVSICGRPPSAYQRRGTCGQNTSQNEISECRMLHFISLYFTA